MWFLSRSYSSTIYQAEHKPKEGVSWGSVSSRWSSGDIRLHRICSKRVVNWPVEGCLRQSGWSSYRAGVLRQLVSRHKDSWSRSTLEMLSGILQKRSPFGRQLQLLGRCREDVHLLKTIFPKKMDSPVEHQTLIQPVVEVKPTEGSRSSSCMGFQWLFIDRCTEGVQGQQRAPNKGESRVNQPRVGGI